MHRSILRFVQLVVTASLAVAPIPAVERTTAAPWDGLHRDELRLLLGEPTKVKRGKAGVETWTLRLVRLDPGEAIAADQRVVDVPGIGSCATPSSGRDPGFEESVGIEPTATDSQGRPASGGLTRSHSKSVAWSKDVTADRVDSGAEAPGSNHGRKVTLRLVLGSDGRVASWTAHK